VNEALLFSLLEDGLETFSTSSVSKSLSLCGRLKLVLKSFVFLLPSLSSSSRFLLSSYSSSFLYSFKADPVYLGLFSVLGSKEVSSSSSFKFLTNMSYS